jgi:hypothetical protein
MFGPTLDDSCSVRHSRGMLLCQHSESSLVPETRAFFPRVTGENGSGWPLGNHQQERTNVCFRSSITSDEVSSTGSIGVQSVAHPHPRLSAGVGKEVSRSTLSGEVLNDPKHAWVKTLRGPKAQYCSVMYQSSNRYSTYIHANAGTNVPNDSVGIQCRRT